MREGLPKKNPRMETGHGQEGAEGGESLWKKSMRCQPEIDHQSICSPYMLGVSPRMKASNVLFRTADQSRSRLSSATLSIHSPSSSTAPAVVRAIRSPLANRGPRSGQCRTWSKGCHLKGVVSPLAVNNKTITLPEIVEVVRERALEKAIESHGLRCRTILSRGVEEVTKPKVPHMSKRNVHVENSDLLLEVWLGRAVSLIKLGIQPSCVEECIG